MVRDIRGRPEGSGQRAWQASGRGEHGHMAGTSSVRWQTRARLASSRSRKADYGSE